MRRSRGRWAGRSVYYAARPVFARDGRGGAGCAAGGGYGQRWRGQGQNRLARNDEIFDSGIVGLTISGPADVQTVVSQGCRPIGKPFVVTKARENLIESLGGHPAMAALREVVTTLSPDDEPLLQNGLMIGRAVSEYRESFGRGDFLVRNVVGVDEGLVR